MIIKINEVQTDIDIGTTLFDLKTSFQPDADIIIYNGHLMTEDNTLKENDTVFFMTRGTIPDEAELEHLLMARHTPGVHEKLKKGRIAIAGIGGLGSNIATSLARMGVGHLTMVDFDVVEPSNINRQYYFLDQLGKPKTEALRETILRINPYINTHFINQKVEEKDVAEMFADFDIIIEAFDKAETKAMFIRKCMQNFKSSIIIGASGVAGIHDTSELTVKKLGNNTYIVGDFVNEAKPGQGLMATRVTVAANIQANLAVQHLLEKI